MRYTCLYADIVGDLFHYGHVNFLRQAKQLCDRLVVGVHSDEDVAAYKRRPIMTMEERIAVVEACRYVDAVVANAPLTPTVALLDSVGAQMLVHGDDLAPDLSDFFYEHIKAAQRLVLVPYTESIATTAIIGRIVDRLDNNVVGIRGTVQRAPSRRQVRSEVA